MTKTVPTGDTGVTWNPVYNQTNNTFSGGTYDSNGNLLTDGFHTYKWNQDNKLMAITDMGISAMTYDAKGRLAEWETGTSYKENLFSPVGTIGIMAKTNVSDRRIPLPGGDTTVGGTGTNFAHKDWLGSTRLESSRGNRTLLEDRAFAPYGETCLICGASTEVNFAGNASDLTAGTYDTPNRELNPNTGRWLSVDPARSGWNPYAYVTNPLSETDTSGLGVLFGGAVPSDFGSCQVSTGGFTCPANLVMQIRRW